MKRIAPATFVFAVAMLLFSGCSGSHVIHSGGTTCNDFITQDENKQNEEIRKVLKDKSGADPNNLEISATRSSTWTYCQTNPNKKIYEAPAECWHCHNGASAGVPGISVRGRLITRLARASGVQLPEKDPDLGPD